MSKLTSKAAASQGYTVDHHVYPWVAYKGPRFRPNEIRNCLTDLEVELLEACQQVLSYLPDFADGPVSTCENILEAVIQKAKEG